MKSIGLFLGYLLLGILWFGSAVAQSPSVVPANVTVCADSLDWPPFLYYQRVDGKPTARSVGYTMDYLQSILQSNHRSFTLLRMPWARCQGKVQTGEIDILVDASDSPERRKKFLISTAYYSTTGIFLYKRSSPMPQIEKVEDLRKVRSCGQHGFTYISFGLSPEQIDTGAYSLDQALAKLQAGHCDVVLDEEEVILGLSMTGTTDYMHHPDFAYKVVPGKPRPTYHMMVSLQLSYGQELMQMLNNGINEQRSNQLRKQDLRLP